MAQAVNRSGALARKTGLRRTKRLSPVSRKQRRLMRRDTEVRPQIISYSETMCIRCWEVHGFPRNAVEVHHVRTRAYRSIRHDKKNLAPLCKDCHDFAHAHGTTFRKWWDARS